jgi:SOS response regulatory protein OraA/RecX
MYCGELCVLGDTSIKPHDRFYVNDTYEDMMGYMEVEAVVFSMNSATGFTTTIYPDTIVRTDDPLESAVRMVNGTMVASCALAGAGRLCAINTFARMDSVLIRTLSTTANFLAATPTDEALATFGASALGKFLHIEKFGKISEAAGAALKAGISTASIITTLVAAAGIYVCAMNTKSWISSFLKHINALTVYPIIKNQRPLIAGMSGHKGSVYGYEYTEQDADDSLQGLIVNVVDWLNGGDKYQSVFPFNFGDMLMDALTLKVDDGNGNKISEYERVKQRWSQTLPLSGQEPGQFDINAEGVTFEQKREALMQSLYTPACLEFGARDSKIQFLRTKYRIPSLQVDKADNLADETYKRYHITGVTTIKQLSTDKKILALYPIEDEPEIKQALVDTSHPVVDKLYIAHSQGNAKVQMPFESGNRIIKFFTEQSGDSYVYDLQMLKEDALIILKLILNHEALTKKQVSFLSGTRVNDVNTWKSTGFSFIIDSNDKGALGTAIEGVLKDTMFLNNKKNQAIFEYKKVDTGYLIIVYAPREEYIHSKETKKEDKKDKTTNNSTPEKKPEAPTTDKKDPNINDSSNQKALKAAQAYINIFDDSKKEIRDQLKHDGYTDSQIQYAIENLVVDWNKEALDSAYSYLELFNDSKKEIRDQLKHDGFTDSQIQYALSNVKANWNQEALKAAQTYIKLFNDTKEELRSQLKHDGFTDSEIEYALNNI